MAKADPVQRGLKRLKASKGYHRVILQRAGQDVEAEVHRPTPHWPTYHATWVDPISGRRVLGQASVAEVHQAMERAVAHA